jgi:hypothetical protein
MTTTEPHQVRYMVDYAKMFSTNMDVIQASIDNSRYHLQIDAKLIYTVNKQLDTHPDFIHYVLFLPEEERNMVIKYQNIFDIDKEMTRILRKKHRTVEESMYLASWVAGMYDTFVDLHTDSDTNSM